MSKLTGAKLTAFLNMQTLKDRPEIGAKIIQDAAAMVGIDLTDVRAENGEYTAVTACESCGARNRVSLMTGRTAVCGRCKEIL